MALFKLAPKQTLKQLDDATTSLHWFQDNTNYSRINLKITIKKDSHSISVHVFPKELFP